MWSLLDAAQLQWMVTPSAVTLWIVSAAACVVIAWTRRHPVWPFLAVGAILGLPGAVLTVVATAFCTPPHRDQVRRLRLLGVWARDPVLRDRIDGDEARDLLGPVRPDLLPIFDRAVSNGETGRFLGRLASYLQVDDATQDLVVFLAATVVAYAAIKALWLGLLWASFDGNGAAARAFWNGLALSSPAIWFDAVLPTLLYIGLRSNRLRVGFGGLLAQEQARSQAWLAVLGLGAGVEPADVPAALVGWEFTEDPCFLGWLAWTPAEAADSMALAKAIELTQAVRSTVAHLSMWLVPMLVCSLLLYGVAVRQVLGS